MRFQITLMHRRRHVAAFDDDIGLAQCCRGIASAEHDFLSDVRRHRGLGGQTLGVQVVVQQRRVGRHRRFNLNHMGQHFVVNLNQAQRFIGNARTGCRYRCDRMANIQYFIARHYVQADIAQGGGALTAFDRNIGQHRKVGRSDDRFDAWQRACRRCINTDDSGVGMRAALDTAGQHSREPQIGAKVGATGDLVGAVGADGPRANDFEYLSHR